MRNRLALAAAIALPLVGLPSQAQIPADHQGRLPELGRSVAGVEDSSALLLNPANLAFMPDGEFRYTGTFLRDSSRSTSQGHALSLGLPISSKVATAFRLDFVDPPNASRSGSRAGAASYRWWTWGGAVRISDSASIGASVQRSSGEGALGAGLTSYSAALSVRPWDRVGLSVVGQDLGSPSNRIGARNRALTAALAVRPWGTRDFEIGLESQHGSQEGPWIPRASLGVDVPNVGRFRAAFQVADPLDKDLRAWSASLGLAFKLQSTSTSSELYGAAVVGDAYDPEGGVDWQMSAAIRGFTDGAGLRVGHHSVRMRVEKTPGPRGHVRWLRRLWALAEQSDVDAVLLELRTAPAATFAHVQELQDALALLQERGKKVLCHLHGGGIASLYLCAAADKVMLHPAASIRFAGLRNRYLYFARLLDKIGVKAEVVGVGEHKSAPESYTRAGPSEVAHADKQDLLQQQDQQLMAGFAKGRGWGVERAREVFRRGPFVAAEAKTEGLVDAIVFDDEIEAAVSEIVGSKSGLRDASLRARARNRFGSRSAIAMVYLAGEMVDGHSQTTPIIGSSSVGSYTIVRALRQARRKSNIKAVVLRIETPGGSALAADLIWREVELTAKVKPVVVSMGGYAASGGYYVSAGATEIFANPLTVTGSIGVFTVKPDASELLGKLGIDVAVYKVNESADADAAYRGLSDAERTRLQAHLQKIYERFVDRVATGRKMTREAVDAVARGRVWTGEQALNKGLVDTLGGLRQALAQARKLANLPASTPVWEYPAIQESLVSRALGIPGLSILANARSTSEKQSELLQVLGAHPKLRRIMESALPFVLHGPEVPLTRLPFVSSVGSELDVLAREF